MLKKKSLKTNYTNKLKNPIFKVIQEASNTLALESYVIGGFVRDMLLERGKPKILMWLLLVMESNWRKR
jgi:hypothetical protein